MKSDENCVRCPVLKLNTQTFPRQVVNSPIIDWPQHNGIMQSASDGCLGDSEDADGHL